MSNRISSSTKHGARASSTVIQDANSQTRRAYPCKLLPHHLPISQNIIPLFLQSNASFCITSAVFSILDRIVRFLGEGTFGKVVECRDNTNDEGARYAIKVIKSLDKYRCINGPFFALSSPPPPPPTLHTNAYPHTHTLS